MVKFYEDSKELEREFQSRLARGREGMSSPGGRAHAALVYDGPTCVGWCQFGPTDELPRVKRRRAYLEGLSALPDWGITCFFVDRT